MVQDNLDKSLLLKLYEMMYSTRLFDEKLIELFQEGAIPGFVHLGMGQEAIPAGALIEARADDYLLYSHRGFGHCIVKGIPMKNLMAELCGKATGSSRGRGGAAHVAADMELGVLGQSGTIGGCFPLSVGVGLGIKNIKKTDQVVFAFFGDGASNRGTFHSSLNMASIWKLPIIYICENNGWAITVPAKRSTAVENIAERAVAYNMPGKTVDGNDVAAVYHAIKEAVKYARAGNGPSLIEAKTYRWRPHAEGFPYYGAEEDAEKGMKFCPLNFLKDNYLSKKVTSEEVEAIENRVKLAIEDAASFAKDSPYPSPNEALEGVLV